MLTCIRCGESLDRPAELPYGYHLPPDSTPRLPLWDSCLRASRGEPRRLLRVHKRLFKLDVEPVVQRSISDMQSQRLG